jgi:galactokinase
LKKSPKQLLHSSPRKETLLDRARLHKIFARHFPRSAAGDCALSWAPGRVNLIGEHTDYNDGFVFPMALDLGIVIYFRPRKDDTVRLYAVGMKEMGEFSLSHIARSPSQPWLNYPMGVAQELIKAGAQLKGLEGIIDANLPIGGGLSSSAALEVSTAQALLSAANITGLGRLKIAHLCRQAERRFVGLSCGIMDQFISLFALPGTALLLDTSSLLYRHVPLPPVKQYSVVICNTGVKHELGSSEYNKRVNECATAVFRLQSVMPEIESLREVGPEQFRRYKKLIPQPARKRAEHVIFENERTLQACRALENNDIALFGKLMNASHASLRDFYQVSCKELDLLVELAQDLPGVLGSRMTGGGFGGCTVSLVETKSMAHFKKHIAAAYKKGTGIECNIFVSGAGGPAGILT